MSKFPLSFVLAILCAAFAVSAFAATSTEVLYVNETQSGTSSLLTYNVNPITAASTEVGNPLTVGAPNVVPVTIGSKNYIYLWDGTDIWVYLTNAQGVASSAFSQHLAFSFSYPVNTFLIDPDHKFAYAVVTWQDGQGNSDAAITLYTINQSNGSLTDTQKVVATYSSYYYPLTSFSFGTAGNRMFVGTVDDGPFTCNPGFDYYDVNQTTGALGKITPLIEVNTDCGGTSSVAVTDKFIGVENACCGAGSGTLSIYKESNPNQAIITCQSSNIPFCGDDAFSLGFDPLSDNIIFPDEDANQTDIGHIDLATSQIVASPSTLQGLPSIYFSPDDKVLYALYPSSRAQAQTNILINSFHASTGKITASTSLPVQGTVTVAATTLKN
jgi:hypothetical protein